MKKIIIAFDGIHFSEGAFEFAMSLNERKRVLLTGVFLPAAAAGNFWTFTGGALDAPLWVTLPESDHSAAIEKNISRFEALCRKNFIAYAVHKDFIDLPLPSLVKESRFADLLIIGSEMFYETLGYNEPNEFLETTLHAVECPAMIVPEQSGFPETNILSYDGSSSSVYAIRQFSYLFPELAGNKTILVFSRKDHSTVLPDEQNISELVKRHFPQSDLLTLDNTGNTAFNEWLLNNKNPLLVSGSFGRSGLSRLLHKSFVNGVISNHKIPVFTAHHK